MFDGIEEVEDDGETLQLPNNFKTQKSCAFWFLLNDPGFYFETFIYIPFMTESKRLS